MNEVSAEHMCNILTTPTDVKNVAESLRRTNVGCALLQNVIQDIDVIRIQDEIQSLPLGQSDIFMNEIESKASQRPTQTYLEFTTNLHANKEFESNELRRIKALGKSIQNLISQDLGDHYQRLRSWAANHLTIRHYTNFESTHYDRFSSACIGVIAIIAIEGSCEFRLKDDYGRQSLSLVDPGDALLIRGNNLFSPNDPRTFIPEYSVANVEPGGFSAVILSSYTRDDAIDE